MLQYDIEQPLCYDRYDWELIGSTYVAVFDKDLGLDLTKEVDETEDNEGFQGWPDWDNRKH